MFDKYRRSDRADSAWHRADSGNEGLHLIIGNIADKVAMLRVPSGANVNDRLPRAHRLRADEAPLPCSSNKDISMLAMKREVTSFAMAECDGSVRGLQHQCQRSADNQ
jgi:hypothetical protein